jgi:hypothetical protein
MMVFAFTLAFGYWWYQFFRDKEGLMNEFLSVLILFGFFFFTGYLHGVK